MLCQLPLYSNVNQLYVYMYHPFFWIFFPFRSPQSIVQSSLCYPVGPHQLSILYIVSIVYIHQSQSPNLSHPPPFTLGVHIFCSLHLCCHETFLTGKIFSIIHPLAMCLFFKVLLKLQALREPFYEQSLYCLLYSHQVIVTFFNSPPIPYWFDTFCRKFISLSLFPEPDTIDLKQFSKLSLRLERIRQHFS